MAKRQVAAVAAVSESFSKKAILFVTKLRFLRLTYEAKGGDDKYGLRKTV